jgi:pyridoxamine 5'-phosphate oxidase
MSLLQPVADIRKDYKLKELSEASIASDPIAQFDLWWNEALSSDIDEVNAMTLATVSEGGLPDGRIVLLKGYGPKGFIFYTNYDSTKGKDLAVHPQACLVFHWRELERQVRICGAVEKVSPEESDAYYHSRPLGSQIGAWASPQSVVIDDRHILEESVEKYNRRFAGQELIPRPPYWGGYRVLPQTVEFWQGRPSRLHDRLRYTLSPDARIGDTSSPDAAAWKIERLAP